MELTNVSEYFDDLDKCIFFGVAVQGYDENINHIEIEEMFEEIDKDFNDYKVLILKQKYPDELINAEFMSDKINIFALIFELQTIIGTRLLSEEIWDG